MDTLSKRALRYAIAGSLIVHVIVAHFVRPPSVSAATEPLPAKMLIVKIVPPPKKPEPTPRPPKQPVRTAQLAVVHAPRLAHNATAKNAPLEKHVATATFRPGAPGPVGPQTPGIPETPPVEPATVVPAVPPTPACAEPDIAARVIYAITPETPELARQEGLSGVAEVRVDLDADGQVQSVSIYRSSGSTLLDAAALNAARGSHYSAGRHGCSNYAGSYIFRAQFDNQ